MSAIRILIAEDSELFAHVLQEMLSLESDLEVVDVVNNGHDAVRRCAELSPDLILMDVHMPLLDGLSATEEIMATSPTPILVVTSDPYRNGVDLSFKALSAGALDLIAKPTLVPHDRRERDTLLRKVRLLAKIPVMRHVRASDKKRRKEIALTPGLAEASIREESLGSPLVGVVASTGGPKALARLLGDLEADFDGGMLIVQHITEGFTEHLARWLDANSALRVAEATHGEELAPGAVRIAPGGLHAEVDAQGCVVLSKPRSSSRARGHCPSGDVLLGSMARHVPARSVGVILSGMGDDGARGLAKLRAAGAPTMAQDEASSVVWGMPHAALAREAVVEVVALDRMATQLSLVVSRLTRRG